MEKIKQKKLVEWLNFAYAMEKEIVEVLNKHQEDAKDYPEIQEKIREHKEVSERHAKSVEECIDSLGGEISNSGKLMAKIIGNLKGTAVELISDKLLLNAISEYATESFEIATYQSIVILSEDVNEKEVAKVCKEIIDDEISMSNWLEENLAVVVKKIFDSN